MRIPFEVAPTPLLCSLFASGLLLACSSGTGPGTSDSNSNNSAVSTTSGGASSNALLCSPTSGQLAACNGSDAGAACTLSDADKDFTLNGTCKPTVDGSAVACTPNPPGPPPALASACSGKASGDACQAQGFFGSFQGVCISAPASGTLFCGRVHTPPQPLVDACTGKMAGDSCALGERRDGGTFSGVCGNGPAGTGPLACRPNFDRTSFLAAACSGQDAGASCTVGHKDHGLAGTCVAPSGGGPDLCILPCGDIAERLEHFRGFGGPWGGWGGHH
ncbi:MAG TPA: hypothetical protein VK454_07445 [Myxococcaceae bacterium]|nr:hypothetical protein [Myxococcaceae bacterium]